MLKIKQFAFNPFGENTYILLDTDSKEALVVDPGMASPAECALFDDFISSNGLKLTQIINTHLHLDHCFGDNYVRDKYGVKVAANEADAVLGYAFCVFQQHLNNNILTDIKTLYIDDLCVDENIRGQHVGKFLYDYVLEFARKEGCYNVTLNVWSCNETAMKFYEKCGLKPQKVGMETIL